MHYISFTYMRYAQLKAFHFVAQTGGFSRAARELSLTQPAISDHIRKLEESYGVELFKRARGGIALTEDGRKLFAITERLFEAETEARDVLDRASSLQEGTLTIGADAAVHILPIVARFRQIHPQVAIRVIGGNTAQLLEKLDNFDIDFAVIAQRPQGSHYATRLLREDRIAAFASASHRLSKRRSINFADLLAETIILREEGSVTRQLLLDEALHRGLSLSHSVEIESREAAREAVAQGLGVAIISEGEFSPDNRLHLLKISDWSPTMQEWLVSLSSRAGLSLVKAFYGCM
jgi:LysR family transcriptional regulator, low CO2-responsive transcriptional regulator